jgi:hypothetical protein
VAASILCSLSAVLAISACSSNATRAVTGTTGVDDGVALATADDITEIIQGEALQIAADVPNDTTNQGVTWAITAGVGSLTAVTNSGVTYVAPTAVTGAATVVITATSIANPLYNAQVTLTVLGSPQLNNTVLFPGNLNLAYVGGLSISGGTAPYVWALSSGALPPGLGLDASTSSVTYVSGTPTALGSYSFTVTITDASNLTSELPFTILINPENQCELFGQYVFAWTGFRNNSPATHLGVLNIDVNGQVTGETDFKSEFRNSPDQSVVSGTCINTTADTGQLALNTASGLYQYNFAITQPDPLGVVHAARLELVLAGSDSGSGLLELQDPTALGGPAPSGNFAFGLVGVDSNALHFGSAGLFNAGGGVISAGLMDSNAATAALTDQATSGTITAPDATGRGQLTLTAGTTTSSFAYYIVTAQQMLLMDIDGATGTPILSGFLTPQVGTLNANTFDATVLGSPSIVSLWGAEGSAIPNTVNAIGRLANGNPVAGQVDLTLQSSVQDTLASDQLYAAQSYTVEPSGRGTLNVYTSSGLHTFVMYFDGLADGYIIEQGGPAGSAGLLEAQQVPAAGFPQTVTGIFAFGTQFPQAPGPVVLGPQLSLNYGELTSVYDSGVFSIDPTSGRGLGNLSEPAIGSTPAAFYMVSPYKIDLLQYATRATNGTIDWLICASSCTYD